MSKRRVLMNGKGFSCALPIMITFVESHQQLVALVTPFSLPEKEL